MKTRHLLSLMAGIATLALAACSGDTGGDGEDGGGTGGTDAGTDAGVECRDNEVFDESLGQCVPDFGGEDAGSDAGVEDMGEQDMDDEPCFDTPVFIDNDGDGSGVDDPATNATLCLKVDEPAPSGFARGVGDCDDQDRQRSPGGVEFCDLIDNNCDDQINEGLTCEFYANTRESLWAIDPFKKTMTEIGSGIAQVTEGNQDDVSFQDLETHPDGRLFAITREQLYEFVPMGNSGLWREASQVLGAEGIGDANGFAIDRDGTGFVTAEDRLYTVDMNTGQATLVGPMNADVYSSGDCVVNKGNTLFMTSKKRDENDRLVRIDRITGQATPLESDTGFDKIFALTAAWGILFGLTGDGEVIIIDEITGLGSLVHTFDGQTFFGSASTPAR